MRVLSHEARELLVTAACVARFRGAQECDNSDLHVADLLMVLHPGVSLYPDAVASTSPEQLPFSAELERVLTRSDDDLGLEELRRLIERP